MNKITELLNTIEAAGEKLKVHNLELKKRIKELEEKLNEQTDLDSSDEVEQLKNRVAELEKQLGEYRSHENHYHERLTNLNQFLSPQKMGMGGLPEAERITELENLERLYQKDSAEPTTEEVSNENKESQTPWKDLVQDDEPDDEAKDTKEEVEQKRQETIDKTVEEDSQLITPAVKIENQEEENNENTEDTFFQVEDDPFFDTEKKDDNELFSEHLKRD